jgi:hypothetical protein
VGESIKVVFAPREDAMTNTKETNKKPYQAPKVIDYGKIAQLTKKPGSRTDGMSGTMGNKGIGS